MIGLLDTVSLRRDLPDLGVSAGQRGTVVHVHGDSYEVEFADADGRTCVLAALKVGDVSPTDSATVAASLTFQIFMSRSGGYTWRLLSAANEIVATGETYPSKDECLRSIRLLARQIRDAEVLDQTAA